MLSLILNTYGIYQIFPIFVAKVLSDCSHVMPVSAMLPKFRTSKRKAFFGTPENLQRELTGRDTATPSHCYENEGAVGSNHSKKKKRGDQYNPDCIDVCQMNESVPGKDKSLPLCSSTLIVASFIVFLLLAYCFNNNICSV